MTATNPQHDLKNFKTFPFLFFPLRVKKPTHLGWMPSISAGANKTTKCKKPFEHLISVARNLKILHAKTMFIKCGICLA